jgi:hypothetical protein
MKTTGTPWPNILADLEAKRGAIDTFSASSSIAARRC